MPVPTRHASPLPGLGLAVLLAASAPSQGCTTANYSSEVGLEYPPASSENLAAEREPPVLQDPAVAVIVIDERRDRSKLGNNNNFFCEKIPSRTITTADSVPAWVKAALEMELWLAGIWVAPDPEGAHWLVARIKEVQVDACSVYKAGVLLEVQLFSKGRPILAHEYRGSGSAGDVPWVGATADAYSLSLSLALRDAATLVVFDVRMLLRPSTPSP
ncbi:MAG TPA: hypothetical protein VMT17_02380 [Anaeromyxobacteraceae bacterium]|nr:hypothetical protein [Anaeromyxobacteraceae bacterium]